MRLSQPQNQPNPVTCHSPGSLPVGGVALEGIMSSSEIEEKLAAINFGAWLMEQLDIGRLDCLHQDCKHRSWRDCSYSLFQHYSDSVRPAEPRPNDSSQSSTDQHEA